MISVIWASQWATLSFLSASSLISSSSCLLLLLNFSNEDTVYTQYKILLNTLQIQKFSVFFNYYFYLARTHYIDQKWQLKHV